MAPPVYSDFPLKLLSTPAFKSGKMDPFTKEASHMALSHNSFIRGFNSIYQQAPRVGEDTNVIKDFIAYCLAWRSLVFTHHHYEETDFFPAIEKATGVKGVMDSEVKEHAQFYSGLEKFKSYLENLQSKESEFNALQLLEIMDAFSGPFHDHLAAEPEAILALSRFSTPENQIDIEKIAHASGKKQMTPGFILNTLPAFLLNMETVEFENGMWHGVFPPIPGVAKYVMYSLVPMWKAGQWKFVSCDAYGARRRLAV